MALADIDHIVVLVMENRSFDHMLGYLSLEGYLGAAGNPIDGLTREMSNPSSTAHPPRTCSPVRLGVGRFAPGPSHGYDAVSTQLGPYVGNDASNRGFVDSYAAVPFVRHPEQIMGYYDATVVKSYNTLARAFGVADRWHCAVPGPTLPNRFFLMAGHSNGATTNVQAAFSVTLRRTDTVFDILSAAGVSWRYYYHDVPVLWLFQQYRGRKQQIRKIDEFFRDAANPTPGAGLPSVSWIDPNLTLQGTIHLPDAGNDDHPPADVMAGQRLVARIYNALRSSPAWSRTLFVITYDEHGGFFDHVPPPWVPDRAPKNDRKFGRLGVRVPALFISPYVQKGSVFNNAFDHCSIIKTITKRFGIEADFGIRVNTALDFAMVVDGAPRELADCPELDEHFISTASSESVVGGISDTPVDVATAPPEAKELAEILSALEATLPAEGTDSGA